MRAFFGEILGTFILVFLGCAAVAAAVLFHSLTALWQVALVWSLAVYLGILASRSWSKSHLNPAVTLAFFATGGMKLKEVYVYILAQFLGGFLAAAALFSILRTTDVFEQGYSLKTAMVFGEYYPNPALEAPSSVSIWQAGIAEALGTAFLLWMIFELTRWRFIHPELKPLLVGLTVGFIIIFVADYTQAGLNPARDFAPRLFSYWAGWEKVAFTQGVGVIVVYILSPIIGGLLAAKVHRKVWK